MNKSKFSKMVVIGAAVGGLLSLLDPTTRQIMKRRADKVTYYAKNPDVLQQNIESEVNKWTSLYERISGEAGEIIDQVSQLKQLTPQMKNLVEETKDAFDHPNEPS